MGNMPEEVVTSRIGSEKGFGLLEVLTAVLVFVLLVYVGSRAFRGVVANHKASSQVTHMNDVVQSTAEAMSSIGVSVLVRPGSPFLQWSKPEIIEQGPMHYRYRIVPKPTVGGAVDSLIAGLQLEAGTYAGGVFTASRTFAALVAPHLASLNGDGQVSTEQERKIEAQFYAGLRQQIDATLKKDASLSETYVNSYSCYAKGECCSYMKRYMANQKLNPTDGLDQKCHHRCAMSGQVSMAEWKKTCGVDFCGLAPWKTKEQCCTAINSGHCLPGSFCAQVCLECVKENGSNCPLPRCNEPVWNDYINCAAGTLCDGSPIPETDLPGWGYAKGICQLPSCQTLTNDCGQWTKIDCCEKYWGRLSIGETPAPEDQICAKISNKSQCCDVAVGRGFWGFQCGSDGRVDRLSTGGKVYCANSNWDKFCRVQQGCGVAVAAPEFAGGGACIAQPDGGWKSSPYDFPFPVPSGGFGGFGGTGGSAPTSPASLGTGNSTFRIPSNRSGGGFSSFGGRE
jgi:hypothetical protein